MAHFQQRWSACGVIAMTLAYFAVVDVKAGEPIRFSKPAASLAAPSKESSNFPEPHVRRMDFSTPEPEAPLLPPPPPPVIRRTPREERTDDRHWLLRNPKLFSDPDEDSRERETSSAKTPSTGRAPDFWSKEYTGTAIPDSSRALSPITDFNWDGREHGGRERDKNHRQDLRDSFGTSRSLDGDKLDSRTRNPFAEREDANSTHDSLRPNSSFDIFAARSKEKPTAMQLQRRAAFEELLNPTAGLAGKEPNSLDPVANAGDAPKQPAALAMPTFNNAKPLESITTFNQQRDRFHAPGFDSFESRRTAQPGASAPAPDSHFQTPLNRQPTVHEFPVRKF